MLFRHIIGTLLLVAGALLTAPALTRAQDAATVTVDAAHALGSVNRLVFGSNVEAGDTKNIFGGVTNTALIQTGNGLWDDTARRPSPSMLNRAQAAGVTGLRYPGGCLVHNFDWKKTVGPVSGRGDWHFGLDEFLTFCRAAHAQPVIMVSDYSGTPKDAADLVEYLNAPANADHPWAKKRAANGHAAPYGVRWFELGNETDHGNHSMTPHRQWTPQEYVQYALARIAAMKRVDPTVKIGIVTAAAKPVMDPWNPVVLAGAGRQADFVTVHTYAVNFQGGSVPEDTLMGACMAAGDQIEQMLHDYHALIKQTVGRDLPLAVTEYNAAFLGDDPKPYRFSYGAALFSADYARVLLQPASGVAIANYWHLANGYWGMVQGEREQAAFSLFHLWAQHFGTQLVAANVQSPRLTFGGYGQTLPAQGDVYYVPHALNTANLASAAQIAPASDAMSSLSVALDGTVTLQLTKATGSLYPPLLTVTRPASTGAEGCQYRLSFQARFLPDAGSGTASLGLGLMDERGWDATHSATAVPGAQNARGWTPFAGSLAALPDAPGVVVLGRMDGAAAPVSGKLEIRHLRLDAVSNEVFPSYAALTASASLSVDKKTLYVIVFNKGANADLPTMVAVKGFHARAARRWTVNGPSLGSDNTSAPLVRETETAVPVPIETNGGVRMTFPAHSMTALELTTFFPAAVKGSPFVNTKQAAALASAALALSAAPVVSAQAAPAASSDAPLYVNDFEKASDLPDGSTVGDGTVALAAKGYQNTQSLRVEHTAAGGAELVRLPLPLDKLKGQSVTFSAMVKAEAVSTPPKPYNGVKVLLHIAAPSGEQWVQQNGVSGTFDWKSVGSTAAVPKDATAVDLFLGLEAVSGAAQFDAVRVAVSK